MRCGVIYVMSVWIAPILLGEAFHTAIPLMRYMMIAILLQGFYMHNMKFLHSYKKVITMSLCSALALVINIWLSISWAPEEGVRGIMLATIVSVRNRVCFQRIITIIHVNKFKRRGSGRCLMKPNVHQVIGSHTAVKRLTTVISPQLRNV